MSCFEYFGNKKILFLAEKPKIRPGLLMQAVLFDDL